MDKKNDNVTVLQKSQSAAFAQILLSKNQAFNTRVKNSKMQKQLQDDFVLIVAELWALCINLFEIM